MTRIDESNQMRANVIEKTTHKLIFVFLTIFAIGGGIRPASTEAVKATSVIENIAAREIDPLHPAPGIARDRGQLRQGICENLINFSLHPFYFLF